MLNTQPIQPPQRIGPVRAEYSVSHHQPCAKSAHRGTGKVEPERPARLKPFSEANRELKLLMNRQLEDWCADREGGEREKRSIFARELASLMGDKDMTLSALNKLVNVNGNDANYKLDMTTAIYWSILVGSPEVFNEQLEEMGMRAVVVLDAEIAANYRAKVQAERMLSAALEGAA